MCPLNGFRVLKGSVEEILVHLDRYILSRVLPSPLKFEYPKMVTGSPFYLDLEVMNQSDPWSLSSHY